MTGRQLENMKNSSRDEKRGRYALLWSGSFLFAVLLSSCTNYDVETADTPTNRKGFENHFGFAPDSTVTNVYYYADELGADVRYQLSFQCPKTTVDKIITELSLKSVLPNQAESLLDPRDDLPWWKPDSIDNRNLWIKEREDEYYWQLWYSEKDGKAFYLEHSL